MSGEDPQDTGGLSPQYHTYEHQKCFLAYTEQAQWSDDLLSACREVLSRPEFNLEPDYARRHFYPDVPLRQKALELIANARYGIYDLSYWRDEEGEWQTPSNVFIELGMAIALNRPTLLLRHANNRELALPECLKSVRGHILEFSGEFTLKRALEECLPQWVNAPPDRDWWNRYCIFGGRTCEYREVHPRARQWEQKALRCHISDGPDVDRDDFRGVVEEVLGRFSDVTFEYLDALSATNGYDFLPCTHCQTVRSTPFAIYRITRRTPAETFIAIGMSIALEKQFEYRIPKILFVQKTEDIPSLLTGYEVFEARSNQDRKNCLCTFLPGVIQETRKATWTPHPLPFLVLEEVKQPIVILPHIDSPRLRISVINTVEDMSTNILDLPGNVDLGRLIKAVVGAFQLPQRDPDGNPANYYLSLVEDDRGSMSSMSELTLAELGVRSGATLWLKPHAIAQEASSETTTSLTPYVISRLCERSGYCAEVCPTDAIYSVEDDPEWPTYYIYPGLVKREPV